MDEGLTNLKVLDLSDNRLTALPSSVFTDLNSLERIQVEGNRLTELPEYNATHWPNLSYAYFERNDITERSELAGNPLRAPSSLRWALEAGAGVVVKVELLRRCCGFLESGAAAIGFCFQNCSGDWRDEARQISLTALKTNLTIKLNNICIANDLLKHEEFFHNHTRIQLITTKNVSTYNLARTCPVNQAAVESKQVFIFLIKNMVSFTLLYIILNSLRKRYFQNKQIKFL
ncbi:uncharacterized protein GBIM_13623, partial [Gryllus bimaculatus]